MKLVVLKKETHFHIGSYFCILEKTIIISFIVFNDCKILSLDIKTNKNNKNETINKY